MKSGDKIKLTKKSISLHFDNMWDRQVTKYYLPILALTVNRDYLPIVTKVTKKYIYQNVGCQYKLSLTVIGYSFEIWWHTYKNQEQRIEL